MEAFRTQAAYSAQNAWSFVKQNSHQFIPPSKKHFPCKFTCRVL
nr:MAG TPA_asm: hypothetical protein [Caudoviricetes sp.]